MTHVIQDSIGSFSSRSRPQTIKQALLDSEQYLAVHIGDSGSTKPAAGGNIRTKDSEIWFFQVADVAELFYYPLRLFDENGNAQGPLSSGGTQDYSRLYDSNGDDILRNDDDDWTVYHFSVGVRQDDVRIYPRVPENQNGGGFTWLTGDEPDPTTPSSFGYLQGNQTSVENPNTSLEGLAWRVSSRSEHQYGFVNDAEVQVDPLVSVVGAAYQLRPVSEEDQMLNLLADMGRPIDEQDTRIHTIEYSRNNLRTLSDSVPEEWKDAQNSLKIEQANLPEDIEDVVDGEEAGQSQQSAGGGS
jgi:hypothetical protein